MLPSLLQALTTKDKIAHMKAAMPANVAKAMGRLSSGLYIVTAQQDDARTYVPRCCSQLCSQVFVPDSVSV